MKSQVIIPTAGLGVRFDASIPKPLIVLKNKPIIAHTLNAFQKSSVHSVVLVVHAEYIEDYRRIVSQYGCTKVVQIVIGGSTRRFSVEKGLAAIDSDTDIILVHDGARPLVSPALINASIAAAADSGAVVAAVPVKFTVKRADKTGIIKETLNRDELWEIQTPQTFQRSLLIKAYTNNTDPSATDDAVLVEQSGHPVKILKGDYKNIKITTPEDLRIAEFLMSSDKETT